MRVLALDPWPGISFGSRPATWYEFGSWPVNSYESKIFYSFTSRKNFVLDAWPRMGLSVLELKLSIMDLLWPIRLTLWSLLIIFVFNYWWFWLCFLTEIVWSFFSFNLKTNLVVWPPLTCSKLWPLTSHSPDIGSSFDFFFVISVMACFVKN